MNNIKWAHDLQFGTKRAYYEKLKSISKKVNKQGKKRSNSNKCGSWVKTQAIYIVQKSTNKSRRITTAESMPQHINAWKLSKQNSLLIFTFILFYLSIYLKLSQLWMDTTSVVHEFSYLIRFACTKPYRCCLALLDWNYVLQRANLFPSGSIQALHTANWNSLLIVPLCNISWHYTNGVIL